MQGEAPLHLGAPTFARIHTRPKMMTAVNGPLQRESFATRILCNTCSSSRSLSRRTVPAPQLCAYAVVQEYAKVRLWRNDPGPWVNPPAECFGLRREVGARGTWRGTWQTELGLSRLVGTEREDIPHVRASGVRIDAVDGHSWTRRETDFGLVTTGRDCHKCPLEVVGALF